MRRLLAILICTLVWFFPVKVFAQTANPPSDSTPKFSVSYDVGYSVAPTGVTTVTQKASLTNLTSEYYASEYVSRITNNKIFNLRAYDSSGPLKIDTSQNGDEEEIRILFNDKVYGKGETLYWTLIFDTNQVATKNGRVWEINIPRPSNLENIDNYTVSLMVPPDLGRPGFLKPEPDSTASGRYHWTKDQIAGSGVSVGFGDFQVYDFDLKYHLYNSGFYSRSQSVALPPDTDYQRIRIASIDRPPADVTVDPDGNWMAVYNLAPLQKMDIEVKGSALVYSRPEFAESPPADLKGYTIGQKFWEVESTDIRKKAMELKTPENIFNYVVGTLHYDTSRVDNNLGRLGAAGALDNPNSAICVEFTDLFIALARAAGIPAREVDGFAYTQNPKRQPLSLKRDILHAWPEYYDGKNWIMVDPTWQNTTGGIDYFHELDNDHITFAIRGQSSLGPLPAGVYKLSGSEHDVTVNFNDTLGAADFLPGNPDYLRFSSVIPDYVIAGLPGQGQVTVSNGAQTEISSGILSITSDILTVNPPGSTIAELPPYARRTVPINFQSSDFSGGREGIIQAGFGGHTFIQKIYLKAFYEERSFYIFIAVAGAIAVGLLAASRKFWRLFLP